MGIKVYTTEAKASGWTSVERVCSFCQKTWTAQVKIEATARGDGSYFRPNPREAQRARERAQQYLAGEEKRAKKQADKGVLCPHCGHFSVGAMAKHFPKGIAAGLGNKFNRALLGSLFLGVLSGPLTIIAGGIVLAGGWKKGEIFGRTLVGAIALALLGSFFYFLARGIRGILAFRKVRRLLHNKAEDEMLAIAVDHYKKNKESLAGLFRWADTLLNLTKPS